MVVTSGFRACRLSGIRLFCICVEPPVSKPKAAKALQGLGHSGLNSGNEKMLEVLAKLCFKNWLEIRLVLRQARRALNLYRSSAKEHGTKQTARGQDCWFFGGNGLD